MMEEKLGSLRSSEILTGHAVFSNAWRAALLVEHRYKDSVARLVTLHAVLTE